MRIHVYLELGGSTGADSEAFEVYPDQKPDHRQGVRHLEKWGHLYF